MKNAQGENEIPLWRQVCGMQRAERHRSSRRKERGKDVGVICEKRED